MKNMEKFNFCLVWVRVNNLVEYTSSKKRLFLIAGYNNDKLYGFLSTCNINEEVYYLQNEVLEIKIQRDNPLVGEMSLVMLNTLYEIDREQISSIFYRLNQEQLNNYFKRILVNKNQTILPHFIKDKITSLKLPYKEGDVIVYDYETYYIHTLLENNLVCYKMSLLPQDNSIEVTMDYKKWFVDTSMPYSIEKSQAKYFNYLYPIHRLQIEVGLRKKVQNTIQKRIPTNIHGLWIGSFFSYYSNDERRMGVVLDRSDKGTKIVSRKINRTFSTREYLTIPEEKNMRCNFKYLTTEQKVKHLKQQQQYGDKND